ncbi:MAG: MMPL family transporter, partial [Verrucomicrobiales bacterium]
IQYTMRFRAELEATGDHRLALSNAHATIGRAIWIATSIIISGFAILLLSEFFPSVWFGLFTSLAMLISQLATLTILTVEEVVTLLTNFSLNDPVERIGQHGHKLRILEVLHMTQGRVEDSAS